MTNREREIERLEKLLAWYDTLEGSLRLSPHHRAVWEKHLAGLKAGTVRARTTSCEGSGARVGISGFERERGTTTCHRCGKHLKIRVNSAKCEATLPNHTPETKR